MQWRSFIKANVAYGIGSVANSAGLFILIPYLINRLTVAEYGAWALLEVTILLLVAVVSLGLDVGLMREYWFVEREEDRRTLVGTVCITVAGWGIFITGSTLLFTSFQPLHVPDGFLGSITLLNWAALIGSVEAFFAVFLALFRIQERPIPFVSLSLLRMFIFITSAIVYVESGRGLEGALLGRLTGVYIALIVAIVISLSYIKITINIAQLKRTLKYGLPLLPYNIASYILLSSDRYVIEIVSSLETVAIYSFAYKIAAGLDILIIRPFNLDWVARRFRIAKRSDAPQQYASVLVWYLAVVCGFSLLLYSFVPLIYDWFAPEPYHQAMTLVPLILISYILYGMEGPVNIGTMIKDRTQLLPIIGFLAAIVAVLLNLVLITQYGILGAALATVIAYGVHTGGLWIVSHRVYPVPFNALQVLSVVETAMAGLLGILLIDMWIDNLYLAVIAKLSFLAALASIFALTLLQMTEWRAQQLHETSTELDDTRPVISLRFTQSYDNYS